MGLLGDVVVFVGLALATLSAAGAPAWLFDDVLGWRDSRAYAAAAVVWGLLTLAVRGTTLELAAVVVVARLTGVAFFDLVPVVGGGLTLLHALGAVGFWMDEREAERPRPDAPATAPNADSGTRVGDDER